MASSSPFPTSPSSPGPFRSYPQKYPKARQKAASALGAIHSLIKQAPHSLVAVVVDTTYHVSQGYVLCTTNHIVVRVYSVPYGSVVAGMRVYIRALGSLVTDQPYVFDGFAPNLSGLGLTGSVLMNAAASGTSPVCYSLGAAATTSATSLTTSTGYYWHCFFYLPSLPSSTVTLFQFDEVTGAGTNLMQLDYLPSGLLSFHSEDNKGFITRVPISPHNAHWVQIQPGLTGLEFLVDTVSNYQGLAAGSTPTFAGAANTYAIALLSTNTGASPAPVGSWISKFGYGANYTGGAPVALPNSIPAYDVSLPSINIGATRQTFSLYLCEDGPASNSLVNTGTYGGSGSLSIVLTSALAQTSGPY